MTLGTDEVVVDEGEKVNKDILQTLGRKLKHFYEAQDHVSDPKASGDSHNDYREAFRKRPGESYMVAVRRMQNREENSVQSRVEADSHEASSSSGHITPL
ncbi:unnamed protein product [Albugo candida]|uniref:Uncharacterized protein n=1 Tax=Albugo candida TaxID=65357 RepID=A0A024FTR2_9STRA|nr:unnamed protein product [Albugo candida]|eukprot:CCI10518.1 unnamed protein product [Albugo candida]